LINFETTLKIDKFPLDYFPVTYPFGGVNSTVSGVGYNAARALVTLGARVNLTSITGRDDVSSVIVGQMKKCRIETDFIVKSIQNTPQSVIIFETGGRRQIHVDLKDIQAALYPQDLFIKAAEGCDALILCNINFSRPMLFEAKRMNKLIATDVHALSSPEDDYNSDFMRHSDILFLSDENIGSGVRQFAAELARRYSNEIIVIGMGSKGALLYVKKDETFRHFEALNMRPVINTIGAGDALFSAFVYFYIKTGDPYFSMTRASAFASYKIGANGGAEGFLTQEELEEKISGI